MTKGKGSSFERQICKTLSLWWTHDRNDDIFWRTAGSGARAKTRSKKSLKTFGQYGDIQATNPIGQPLIDFASIELKRGYSKSTFADLMEPSTHAKPVPCQYEKFIQQAEADYLNSDSYTWLLIVKRDRRKAIVLMPFFIYKKFKDNNIRLYKAPCFHLSCQLSTGEIRIFGCALEQFLSVVQPNHIKQLFPKKQKPKQKYPNKTKKELDKEAQVYKCVSLQMR